MNALGTKTTLLEHLSCDQHDEAPTVRYYCIENGRSADGLPLGFSYLASTLSEHHSSISHEAFVTLLPSTKVITLH
jgi:hypothetical protein